MALASMACLAVAGCGRDHADLRDWMDQVRSEEKVSIDPLPVLKPYEKFVYKADGLKSPFLDTLEEQRLEEYADTGAAGFVRT